MTETGEGGECVCHPINLSHSLAFPTESLVEDKEREAGFMSSSLDEKKEKEECSHALVLSLLSLTSCLECLREAGKNDCHT